MIANNTATQARSNRIVAIIITLALIAVAVIQVPSLVDQWNKVGSQRVIRAELMTGKADESRAEIIDQRLQVAQNELAAYKRAMIDVESMPAIQNELMELAQQCGCQLRKAVILAGSSETWELEVDDELPEEEFDGEESPYSLGTEQISLSLSGSRAQTLEFLNKLYARPWLMKVSQISLSRDPDTDGKLAVEANLAFYRLTKSEQRPSEFQ